MLTFHTGLRDLDVTKAVKSSSRHRNAAVILSPRVQITLLHQVLLLLLCVFVCASVCVCSLIGCPVKQCLLTSLR